MNADWAILWMAGHGWLSVIGGRVAIQVDAAELLPRQTLDPSMQNEMLPIRNPRMLNRRQFAAFAAEHSKKQADDGHH